MSERKKGFTLKLKPGVVKLPTRDIIDALKQPVSTGQVEAVPQSFEGNPAPPTSKKIQVFPFAKPGKPPADTGPSLPPPPQRTSKPPPSLIEDTPDVKKHIHKVSKTLQEYIDNHPTLLAYQQGQRTIETNNPYLTNTEFYTPQTRRSFYRFISDNYGDEFKLLPQVKGKIDEDACQKLGEMAGTQVEAFLYQKFIREYVRNASPYRGILVYHGLGSGKTCSAIAAAEALYGTADKKIIVMTPYSLRGNFMSEISFCGFRHFSTHNHWIPESLISEGGMSYLYARSVLSLSQYYLTQVMQRSEEQRKVIWIPDFTKPSNYESLSQQERDDIRSQITNSIESRIEFISYNGVTASTLKKYACQSDPVTGERMFDNAVIVIDEIHNLTRLMQGEISQYITQRKGKQRKIPVEPIVPGKWVPGLCGKPLNYKRAYLFYKLLTDARNSKIIGLSGTPIINFPDEIGVLANVLSGYTECATFTLYSTNEMIKKKVKEIIEKESRVDMVRFRTEQEKMGVLVSVFQEGYERVEQDNQNVIAVRYNEDAQEGIRTVFQRIETALKQAKIPMSAVQFVSYPRLPIDTDEFKQEFINSQTLSIENKFVLQKRLTGLISYYKGSKEEYMPRVEKDEVIKCEMSDYTLSMYTVERNAELKGEKKKDQQKGDAYADVEMFARMKNPSSYRFRSRALCNFSFPKSIPRPFPGNLEEETMEVVDVEDVVMTEVGSPTEEDLKAQELVAKEDESIEEPDVDVPLGEGDKETDIDLERIQEGVKKIVLEEEKKQEGGENVWEEVEDLGDVEIVNPVEADVAEDDDEDAENIEEEEEEPENPEEEEDMLMEGGAKDVFVCKSNELSDQECINDFALQEGWSVIDIPGDGNCFFRVLEEYYKRQQRNQSKTYQDLRQQLVDYLVTNYEELYKNVISLKEIEKLRKDGAWNISAGDLVIPGSTGAFDMNIHLYDVQPSIKETDQKRIVMYEYPETGEKKSKTVSIARISQNHFNLLIKKPLRPKTMISTSEKPKLRPKTMIPVKKVVQEVKEIEEEEAKEVKPGTMQRMVSYQEQLQRAMAKLEEQKDRYLKLDSYEADGALRQYSSKLDAMLRRIETSKGSNLVYSQFKTVEGLGVLRVALLANGYKEIKIEGGEWMPRAVRGTKDNTLRFSQDTIESFQKGPAAKEKRFLFLTGEGLGVKRNLVLNLFNGNFDKIPDSMRKVLEESGYGEKKNRYGDICWVFGITAAGAEGISLKCCRTVHIMEPYWNKVRLDQVKGRAVRICSHQDLPYKDRTVDIYTYYTVFSADQINSKLDMTIRMSDESETSDEKVYLVSLRKDKINQEILNLMKESAVDCGLNRADNEDVRCVRIDGRPDQYLFDPDLEVDKIITNIEFKAMEQEKEDVMDKMEVVAKKLGEADVIPKKGMIRAKKIRYRGVNYILQPKPNTGGLVYLMFSESDDEFMKPLGEIATNPLTSTFEGSKPELYRK